MPDDEPGVEQSKFAIRTRPWISATLLVAMAALGWSVADTVGKLFDSVRVELSTSVACCESFRTYRTEDSAQRKFWVDVIRQLQVDDHKQDERISELYTAIAVLDARLAASPINREADIGAAVNKLDRRMDRLEKKSEQ